MLIRILGAVDLIAGLILIFGGSFAFPDKMLLILGGILLVKSLLGFFKDFASWIDFSTGIVFLLSSIISMPGIVGLIFGLLIIQKGVISFF